MYVFMLIGAINLSFKKMEVDGQQHVPAALPRETDPVPISQEACRPQGRSERVRKSRLHQDSTPDCQASSQSLYRINYPSQPSALKDWGELHISWSPGQNINPNPHPQKKKKTNKHTGRFRPTARFNSLFIIL
jgi:hypothetical protein